MSSEGSTLVQAYKRQTAFSSAVYAKVGGKEENASGRTCSYFTGYKVYLLHAA